MKQSCLVAINYLIFPDGICGRAKIKKSVVTAVIVKLLSSGGFGGNLQILTGF